MIPSSGQTPKNGGTGIRGLDMVKIHLTPSEFGSVIQILIKIKARFLVQEGGEEDHKFAFLRIVDPESGHSRPITEEQYGNEHPRFKNVIMEASRNDFVYFVLNPQAREAETAEPTPAPVPPPPLPPVMGPIPPPPSKEENL